MLRAPLLLVVITALATGCAGALEDGSEDAGVGPSGLDGGPGASDAGPGPDDAGPLGNDAGPPTGPLALTAVVPATGGASAATAVVLRGTGFGSGLTVTVGAVPATDVVITSDTELHATFPSVALLDRGAKDVVVHAGADSATLPAGFTYEMDEDPIVFVHGYAVDEASWDTMKQRFRDLGYPDAYLWAIPLQARFQSNIVTASEDLPGYVDDVLAATGADKVDIIGHSHGGQGARLWVKAYGGETKVRDFISLSGTHHGTNTACNVSFLAGADEQCPSYASEEDSVNGIQFLLNGDPDTDDVDETPFGVEDGGDIAWTALWTESDTIDLPPETCCLNQHSRNDCSDPVNQRFSGVGHIEMASDPDVFVAVEAAVRARNQSRP